MADSQPPPITLQPDASMGGFCAAIDDAVQQKSN